MHLTLTRLLSKGKAKQFNNSFSKRKKELPWVGFDPKFRQRALPTWLPQQLSRQKLKPVTQPKAKANQIAICVFVNVEIAPFL